MSVPVNVKSLTETEANKCLKDLQVKSVSTPGKNKRYTKAITITPYHVTEDENGEGDIGYLPFHYTLTTLGHHPKSEDTYPKINLEFHGALNKLHNSQEKNQVTSSYIEAAKITEETKRVAEEISLMRWLPGRCRVCKRMGV